MWARRNLAILGVLTAMLFMSPSAMRAQGLMVRSNRAGMESVGLVAVCGGETRMAEAGETARLIRNLKPGDALCLLARGRGADAQDVVRRALNGSGQALDAHLAEGMDGGIQAAARVDEAGVRLYLADPCIPMDY